MAPGGYERTELPSSFIGFRPSGCKQIAAFQRLYERVHLLLGSSLNITQTYETTEKLGAHGKDIWGALAVTCNGNRSPSSLPRSSVFLREFLQRRISSRPGIRLAIRRIRGNLVRPGLAFLQSYEAETARANLTWRLLESSRRPLTRDCMFISSRTRDNTRDRKFMLREGRKEHERQVEFIPGRE